jgi:transposase
MLQAQNISTIKSSITPEIRKCLIKLEKTVLNKYASTKIKIVLALSDPNLSSLTQKQIAQFCLLDEDTITKIKQDFLSCGGDFEAWIDTDYHGGNGSKLTEQQEQEISKYIEDNMFCSSAIIQDYIFTTYQVFYSISGMVKMLHRLDFCYKKPILVPDKLSPQLQTQWLQEYWELEKELANQPQETRDVVLFGDACHPTHNTLAKGCWQKVGRENTKELKAKTGRDRVNIVGGYGLYNQQAIIEQYETINAESILDFVKKVQTTYKWQDEISQTTENQLLIHQSNQTQQLTINPTTTSTTNPKNIYIVLDNARVHHSNIVNDWLISPANQEANNRNLPRIIFKFLPAYSPNLNKIEPFWKYLKKQIANKFYSTFQEFKQAINDFVSNLHSHKPQLAKFITNKFHLFQGV